MAHALAAYYHVTILQIASPGQLPKLPLKTNFQEVISAPRGKSYTPLKILRGLTGPHPVTVLNYTSRGVARTLADVLEGNYFDAVQMESIHLFRYLEVLNSAKRPPAALLDWHNIESELMRRYAENAPNPGKKFVAGRTANLLRRLEDKALESFAAHTVVSDREKEKLLERVPHAEIHVIPNGVDTGSFAAHSEPLPVDASRHTLLFVGSMDYHANSDAVLWFCREIWPRLATEFPALEFKIVGRNPPPSVQALASARVIVTGTVDDVRPFYHQAFALLAPLRVGGGTRLKILEAMAAGVPVISTRLGAEGLDAEDHVQFLLADSADEMAASIRALLYQPELAPRLCLAARNLVQSRYDWSALGRQLATVHQSLTR